MSTGRAVIAGQKPVWHSPCLGPQPAPTPLQHHLSMQGWLLRARALFWTTSEPNSQWPVPTRPVLVIRCPIFWVPQVLGTGVGCEALIQLHPHPHPIPHLCEAVTCDSLLPFLAPRVPHHLTHTVLSLPSPASICVCCVFAWLCTLSPMCLMTVCSQLCL